MGSLTDQKVASQTRTGKHAGTPSKRSGSRLWHSEYWRQQVSSVSDQHARDVIVGYKRLLEVSEDGGEKVQQRMAFRYGADQWWPPVGPASDEDVLVSESGRSRKSKHVTVATSDRFKSYPTAGEKEAKVLSTWRTADAREEKILADGVYPSNRRMGTPNPPYTRQINATKRFTAFGSPGVLEYFCTASQTWMAPANSLFSASWRGWRPPKLTPQSKVPLQTQSQQLCRAWPFWRNPRQQAAERRGLPYYQSDMQYKWFPTDLVSTLQTSLNQRSHPEHPMVGDDVSMVDSPSPTLQIHLSEVSSLKPRDSTQVRDGGRRRQKDDYPTPKDRRPVTWISVMVSRINRGRVINDGWRAVKGVRCWICAVIMAKRQHSIPVSHHGVGVHKFFPNKNERYIDTSNRRSRKGIHDQRL
ncbi:hypothetical protein F5I97DRAFT_2071655 [Phlebopus sp. FC_14]|nr:hypothetical protein F5I97DRAFT_2071655 [Phlebopus sp. FC_14]